MGTWGSGNFDSDTALDYLADVIDPLVEAIRKAMEEPESMEPDEWDGTVVPCNVEILTLLAEKIGISLPEPEEIAQWKQTYLSIWDGYIDQLDPKPEYKIERRAKIIATFERLAQLAKEQNDDA